MSHGEPGLGPAGGLRPVDFAGPVRWGAVRPAAALPAPLAPAHRPSGRHLLPDSRHCVLPVPAAPGRRRAAGLSDIGRAGRRGAVLQRLFPASSSGMGFLGRYVSLLGAFAVFSSALGERFWKKDGPIRKKSLLFCREMLYNKKNWVGISQRRRQAWRKKPSSKKSAPGPVC